MHHHHLLDAFHFPTKMIGPAIVLYGASEVANTMRSAGASIPPDGGGSLAVGALAILVGIWRSIREPRLSRIETSVEAQGRLLEAFSESNKANWDQSKVLETVRHETIKEELDRAVVLARRAAITSRKNMNQIAKNMVNISKNTEYISNTMSEVAEIKHLISVTAKDARDAVSVAADKARVASDSVANDVKEAIRSAINPTLNPPD